MKALLEEIQPTLESSILMAEFRKGKNGVLSQKLAQKIDKIIISDLSQSDQLTLEDYVSWKKFDEMEHEKRLAFESFFRNKWPNFSTVFVDYAEDVEKLKELNHFVFIHRFEAYAKYSPNATALETTSADGQLRSLTYKELNEQANQLASYLINVKKVKKGERIVSFLPRDFSWIIATLATWKIGAVLVPIDPHLPPGARRQPQQYLKKFRTVLQQSHPAALLTTSQFESRVPPNKTVCMDNIQHTLDAQPTENPSDVDKDGFTIDPFDLAYIMYTSGSTKVPKGAVTEHRGLVPCLESHREMADFTCHSKMALYASPGFDAWLAETLILGVGGTLVIVPNKIRIDSQKLKEFYQKHEVTIAILTPAVLQQFGDPSDLPKLKTVFSVGANLLKKLVKLWQEEYGRQIINGYGLTETTIATTLYNAIYKIIMEKYKGSIPVGKPILGTTITLRPVDGDDEKKEIVISGLSVAREYYGPAKQEYEGKFFEENDLTSYKSGDTGYQSEDGLYIVEGRADREIKLSSGVRENLDYIEACIETALQQSTSTISINDITVVSYKGVDENEPRLVIYLVPSNSNEKNPTNLKELQDLINGKKGVILEATRLGRVSASIDFYPGDSFPVKSSKKDYDTILDTYQREQNSDTEEQEKVKNKKLAKLWAKALNVDFKIEDDHDFFMLGGSSIKIMELMGLIKECKKYKKISDLLSPNLFFDYPTLKEQRQLLERLKNVKALKPQLIKHKALDKHSENPTAIFCIHSILGNAKKDYNKLSKAMGKDYALYGINARALEESDRQIVSIDSTGLEISIAIQKFLRKNENIRGPINILAYSSGGSFGLAAAQHLINEGYSVYLHMIDSASPFLHHRLSFEQTKSDLLCLSKKLGEKVKPKSIKETQDIPTLIDQVFDKMSHQKTKKIAHSIRQAEYCYFPEDIPAFSLYQASSCLYVQNGIIEESPEFLCWPKSSILNPTERPIKGDHFSIMDNPKELSERLKLNIKAQLKFHKVNNLDDEFLHAQFYVSPNAEKKSDQGLCSHTSEPTSLSSITADFLKSKEKRLLIAQGESGIGKSTFTESLHNTLDDQEIPNIRINLSDLGETEILNKVLSYIEKSNEKEIHVIILDGYDEQLDQENNWVKLANIVKLSDKKHCKFITTCRSEILFGSYKENFYGEIDPIHYTEILIKPLTLEQIHEFIEVEIKRSESPFTAKQILSNLTNMPDIAPMIQNPQLLKYIISVMKDLLGSEQNKPSKHITPYKIYNLFIDKISKRSIQKKKTTTRRRLSKASPHLEYKKQLQNIALLFFQNSKNSVVIDLSEKTPESDFLKSLLISDECENNLKGYDIREIMIPSLNENECKVVFKHATIKDFLCATALSRILLQKYDDYHELQTRLNDYKLTPKLLVQSDSFVKFWQQACLENPNLKDTLLTYVKLSQNDKSFSELAAISITLLNLGNIPLSYLELPGISIPNAILDTAILEHSNFERANLTGVSFVDAYMPNVNMQGSDLTNAIFLQSNKNRMNIIKNFVITPFNVFFSMSHDNQSIILSDEIVLNARKKTYTSNNVALISDEHNNLGFYFFNGIKIFFKIPFQVNSISYDKTGEKLLLASENNQLIFLNTTDFITKKVFNQKLESDHNDESPWRSLETCQLPSTENRSLKSRAFLLDSSAFEEVATRRLESLQYTILNLQFQRSGDYLVAQCSDDILRIFSYPSLEVVKTFTQKNQHKLFFSHTQDTMLSLSKMGEILAFSLPHCEEMFRMNISQTDTLAAQLSIENNLLITSHEGGIIHIHNYSEKQHIHSIQLKSNAEVIFTNNQNLSLLTKSGSLTTWQWDSQNCGYKMTLNTSSELTCEKLNIEGVIGLQKTCSKTLSNLNAIGKPQSIVDDTTAITPSHAIPEYTLWSALQAAYHSGNLEVARYLAESNSDTFSYILPTCWNNISDSNSLFGLNNNTFNLFRQLRNSMMNRSDWKPESSLSFDNG